MDLLAAGLVENLVENPEWRSSTRSTSPRFLPGQRRRPFSTLRDVESRSARERPLCMSLSVDAPAGEALDVLSRFRVEFYEQHAPKQEAEDRPTGSSLDLAVAESY